MNNDLITIIIPCYNAEKTVGKCIASLLSQTYDNLEIIAINDGSIDDTELVLKRLSEKDKRLKYMNQENKGVSYSRNMGIINSKGKYIAFVDSDDYVQKNYIKCMHDVLIKERAQLAVCKYIIIKNHHYIYGKRGTIADKKSLIREMMIPKYDIASFCFNRLYIRDILLNNDLLFDNDIHVCEDVLFNYQYLTYVENVAVCNKHLYNYVINKNGTMFSADFNPNKITANKAYSKMLAYCHDAYEKEMIEKSATLFNLILKRQIYKSHYPVDSKNLKMINKMLRMNPIGFLREEINMKYKIAYPFWALI